MTVNELLKMLRKIKKEHGDIVVGVGVNQPDNVMDVYSVVGVAHADAPEDSKLKGARLAIINTEY